MNVFARFALYASCVTCVVALTGTETVRAGGCALEWAPVGTGVASPFGGYVNAVAQFDDGTGNALYVGGGFTSAGGLPMNHIARWDGSAWSSLDSGPGTVGTTDIVNALAVYDDGSGPALYAAGEFTMAGGIETNYIAKWDGTQWSPLVGPNDIGLSSRALALAVYDDGNGPALYAGGSFVFAGGYPANRIAKWDGTRWSPLVSAAGPGLPAQVLALEVFDDGDGPALYAAGDFASAGGMPAGRIAKWDGASWSVLTGSSGTGVSGRVRDMTVYDDGSGAALFVGGEFGQAGGQGANRLAKWDGSEWSAPTGSVPLGVGDTIFSLEVFDDGNGPALFAGGFFEVDGIDRRLRFGRWDGIEWSDPSGPINAGPNGVVRAMTVFDDGSGPSLHVGGGFNAACDRVLNGVAKVRCSLLGDCDGDINLDGQVDLADLNTVLLYFGSDSFCGDATADGVVDLADLNAVLTGFGEVCP